MDSKAKKQLVAIFLSYSQDRGNLLPILSDVQQEIGYLSEEAMEEIAKFLNLSNSTVYSVATFYALFKFTPTGKKIVKVCRGTACHVRGGARILREAERCLGIKQGETSDDLEYSLEAVTCFGSCALAPVMVVDSEVYGRMTTTKMEQILSNNK